MTSKHIVVLGAGAWGTALAVSMANAGHPVTLICRRLEHAQEIQRANENQRYLPGISLPRNIEITSQYEALQQAAMLLWVIPTQHSQTIAKEIGDFLPPSLPVIICSKGIDRNSEEVNENSLLTAILSKILPNPLAVLSGPNLAKEIAQGLPAAATLAAFDSSLAQELSGEIRHPFLRIYASDDPVGVQISGAIKNVLAIASGIVVGRSLGNNANAALITRGLAEMRRLGMALGGKLETFLGLAAVGDLTLTCSSPQSRNMSLGIALGQGQTLDDILKSRHTVAEGVYTAQAAYKLSAFKRIPMPICQTVYNILYEHLPIDMAIEAILSKQAEWEDQ